MGLLHLLFFSSKINLCQVTKSTCGYLSSESMKKAIGTCGTIPKFVA